MLAQSDKVQTFLGGGGSGAGGRTPILKVWPKITKVQNLLGNGGPGAEGGGPGSLGQNDTKHFWAVVVQGEGATSILESPAQNDSGWLMSRVTPFLVATSKMTIQKCFVWWSSRGRGVS